MDAARTGVGPDDDLDPVEAWLRRTWDEVEAIARAFDAGPADPPPDHR